MKGEIIQEVWQAKDAIAAKHKHNVEALARYLRRQERLSSARVVDLHAKRATSAIRPVAEVTAENIPIQTGKRDQSVRNVAPFAGSCRFRAPDRC